jgi:hypothetical protein
MNDLPIRLGPRGDLSDIFLRPFDRWSILYLPLPAIAVMACLLGIAGAYRQRRTAPGDRPNLVLALPFLFAAWIAVAMMFVGWIPEVV